MADENRRRADLARESADQVVDLRGVPGVELARGLVGNEELRTVDERSTDRHALLLPAGELRRQRISPVEQPDTLEQRVCGSLTRSAVDAEQGQPQRDEIARRQLGSESARVVLVGVSERARPVLEQHAAAQRPQVVAENAHGAGRRPVEAGEDP